MTYYGPHLCSECGKTIVKQAREEGGRSFDPPELLMRVYARGSEAGNVDMTYPMTWTPHVCRPARPDSPVSESPSHLIDSEPIQAVLRDVYGRNAPTVDAGFHTWLRNTLLSHRDTYARARNDHDQMRKRVAEAIHSSGLAPLGDATGKVGQCS